jgi:hypothetical protein
MKKISYIFGFLLLFIGVILILSNFGVIEIVWENLWPLFLLIPGIVFELSYFIYRKDAGLLVPGGILIMGAISLFFLINNLFFIDFGLVAGIMLMVIGIWIIVKKAK